MGDENSGNVAGQPSPTGPNMPSQVVIVQQSPSDDDRQTIADVIMGLLGTDGSDESDPRHQQARKMTLTLSRHNLLIVIALFILVGSQLTNIILQVVQSKKNEKPELQGVDVSLLLSAEAIQKASADAQRAAATAHEDAMIAQRAATTSRPLVVQQPDPSVIRAIVDAFQRNPQQASSGDTRLVIAPIPIQSPGSLASQTAPISTTDHHGVLRLVTVKIKPWIKDDRSNESNLSKKKQNQSLGHLNVSADYKSDEPVPVMLLNANAFLTIDDFNPGTQGLAGVCPVPQRMWSGPMNGHHEDFTLSLSEGWTSADRQKAKEAWDKGPLYVTFCTTYESADASPILNRQVFRVTIDPSTKAPTIEPDQMSEDFLNVALQ